MRKTSHGQTVEPILEYLLRWLRYFKVKNYIVRNSVVADLGTGYEGILLKRISNKIKYGVGFDIRIKKTGLPENIRLEGADLNGYFNKTKNRFDFITALAVLEHVENPNDFLYKARTMLDKKGKILITTPHKNAKPFLECLSFLGLISKDEISDHKNYFDEKTLKKLLKEQNFTKIKVDTFEFGFNIFAIAQKG